MDQLLDFQRVERLLHEKQTVGRRNPQADIHWMNIAVARDHHDLRARVPGSNLLGGLQPVEPRRQVHVDEGNGERSFVAQGLANRLDALPAVAIGDEIYVRIVVVMSGGAEQFRIESSKDPAGALIGLR